MKTLTYNEAINNILKILELVQKGEEIVIKNASNKENVAVIIPFDKYQKKKKNQKRK